MIAARLSGFYAAFFLAGGIQLPFWPVWLAGRSLTAPEIGFCLALSQAVKLVAGPTGGWLADRFARRKTPMILLAAGMLVSFAGFLPAHGFLAIALVTGLVAACQSPLMPLGENLVVLTIARHRLDYGRVRVWGSVTFIAGSVGVGGLLTRQPPELVMWLVLAAHTLTLLSVLTLPDTRPAAPASVAHASPLWLLRRPAFLLFLAAGSLVAASHAVLYGFATLHWRAGGIDSATIGLLWAVGVVAEIALFTWGGGFARRLGVAGLLALAAGAGVVRWTVTALTLSLWVLVPAQALHALTFGAAHLGAIQFITRAIPPQLSATAQSVYSAVAVGGVFGLAMWASGGLYAAIGPAAFHVMTALSLIALAPALLLARRWNGSVLT